MLVGMIGLGNMGCAVANLIAENGYEVLGWERDSSAAAEIREKRTNSKYLPGVKLSERLKVAKDLDEIFDGARIIFVAIPSVFMESVLKKYSDEIDKRAVVVNLSKGINSEALTSCQILSSIFPGNDVIALSGPSIANEFARGEPTVVSLAGSNRTNLIKVAKILDNDNFRTRFSDDRVGTELGGILKNIYSIGLGIFDGAKIESVNFRAAYLTIALEEMTRVGEAFGAKKETFSYIAGMGDLLATSLSEHSHNRRLGEYLSAEMTLEEIKDKMGVLPEGYNTLKNILYLSEKLRVSIPLANRLWLVIQGKEKPRRFISNFIKDFIEDSL